MDLFAVVLRNDDIQEFDEIERNSIVDDANPI